MERKIKNQGDGMYPRRRKHACGLKRMLCREIYDALLQIQNLLIILGLMMIWMAQFLN